MKKLIIWDFDGVISDTEKLWVTSKMNLLNDYFNLNWNFETAAKYLSGRSDKDKKIILKNMGIDVPEELWIEAKRQDMKKMANGLILTPGIEDIFKLSDFEQCIATGGTIHKTAEKIKYVGIGNYFPPEKVFSADLVKYGKPEPDLFLLAAKTMGYVPQDCIVIEDSPAGLTAALRAEMFTIAFVKYDTPTIKEEIAKMNIEYIFDDMADIKRLIETLK